MQPQVPQRRNNSIAPRFLFLAVLVLGSAAPALAASGTIDATNKYAFSNIGGWINFSPTKSTVTVTDSALTGYAWSANDGWINLSPTLGGVKNDGKGILSGYAWDPSAGWVSFTGVTIDTTTGKFSGKATGDTIDGAVYTINFDCTYCDVVTDWRPTVASSNTTTSAPGAISPIIIPLLTPIPPLVLSPIPIIPSSPPASRTSGSSGTGPTGSPGAAGKRMVFPSEPALTPPTKMVFNNAIPSASHAAALIKSTTQKIFASVSGFLHNVVQSIAARVTSFFKLFFKF